MSTVSFLVQLGSEFFFAYDVSSFKSRIEKHLSSLGSF